MNNQRELLKGRGGSEFKATRETLTLDDSAATRLLSKLNAVKSTGANKWVARCPAHDDGSPSLAVTAVSGRVLIHCFAGCESADIVAALNLTMPDLFDSPRELEYRYDNGRTAKRYYKDGRKGFAQSHTGNPPELYRLAKVRAAVAAGSDIYLAEGEEDVRALESYGVVATTTPQGAANWSKADYRPLEGADVYVIADNDKAGLARAQGLVNYLPTIGVKVAGVFTAAHGLNDVGDHVAAGFSLLDLVAIDTSSASGRRAGSTSDSPSKSGKADNTELRTLALVAASQIKSSKQRFFWADRIPTSTVSMMAGRGGEGKSTFAFHIASELTLGTLPGDFEGKPSPVLIWSGEDRWETVIIPRLKAAGANLDLVFKLGIESTLDAETLEVTPNLPTDLQLVHDAILETGARLVIFDPISSTMGGDLNKEADTRRALDGLAKIAHTTGTVALCIRHFNKGQGAASDKMSGSHAFRDIPRSVFLFAMDDETGQRVLTQDKGNYSEHGTGSLAFTLESVDVPTDDGDTAQVARVVMLGDSNISVGDIINRMPGGEGEHEDRNAAQAFILDYLKEVDAQEAPASDVLKAGRIAGFNETEMKNARKRSRNPRIVSRKSGFGAGWVWAIDPDPLPEGVTKVSKVSLSESETPWTPSTETLTPSATKSTDSPTCLTHRTPTWEGLCGRCEAEKVSA